MELSAAAYAFIKLGVLFGVMLVGLRYRVDLWISLLGGCLLIALMCHIPLPVFLPIFINVFSDRGFLALAAMLFLILMLSGVQSATGQNRRLVIGLERYLRWPRIRLLLFPALVGLLPMPGGALFSCPMINDAARAIPISSQRKVLINYWFRHIWELSWPLYPGYILISSLLHLPLTTLILFNFPLVILAFAVGWVLLLRNIETPDDEQTGPDSPLRLAHDQTVRSCGETPDSEEPAAPEGKGGAAAILYEGLPLLVTFLGALAVSLLMSAFSLNLPSQFAFIVSTGLAVAVSLYQGRKERTRSLFALAFNYGIIKILLLVYAIFCFKDSIGASDIISSISSGNTSTASTYVMFIVLPFIGAMLTGIMVGYVGATFPILLGLADHMGMHDELLLLVMIGLVIGNAGQLLSPLHVCLVVSCDYFRVSVINSLRTLLLPVVVLAALGLGWAFLLYSMGARI